jgi:hypothetical protein
LPVQKSFPLLRVILLNKKKSDSPKNYAERVTW